MAAVERSAFRWAFSPPYIQEALEGEDLPYHFEFEDTVLVWAGWGEALEFHLTDLRIADTNGETLAAVPAASLGLSGASLLRGSIAPTSIELIEPRLGLVRRPDGSVHLATSGEGVSTDDAASDALVTDLLDPPREDHPLALLKRGSACAMPPSSFGTTWPISSWKAPDADLTLNLDDDAVLGHLSVELLVQDLETHLEVELFHHRESKMGSAAIGFAGLNLAELAFIVPELEDFDGIRVPLSGTLAFDIAPGGILGGVAFDIAGGERGDLPVRDPSRTGPGSPSRRHGLDRRRAVAGRSRVARSRYRPPAIPPRRRNLANGCRFRHQGEISGARLAPRRVRQVLAGDVHRGRPRMDRGERHGRRDHPVRRRSRYRAG